MTRCWYDAHNHLHDARLAACGDDVLVIARAAGVAGMVVNGCGEHDWDAVAARVAGQPDLIPSFGLHPWWHHQRSSRWLDGLHTLLLQHPRAGVGEIGLDRWKEGLPYEEQEAVFLAQWQVAVALNRPVSVHCLKAWGRLHSLLREHPAPERGFLLHSYGGPVEMVDTFVQLGGYFSFPGAYLAERKEPRREVFRKIPLDRLLIETDAPDQMLPGEANRYPLCDSDGEPLNHPANLGCVYEGCAAALGMDSAALARAVEQNFRRLFGGA